MQVASPATEDDLHRGCYSCGTAVTSGFIAIALLLCLCAAGCETAPARMIYVSPHMLPQGNLAKSEKEPPLFSGQRLVIEPITRVGASNARALSGALGVPGTAVIWSQTFHEALFKALGDSGLFEEVRRDGTARSWTPCAKSRTSRRSSGN